MTVFNFIKRCLRREAARTEPDCARVIQQLPAQNPSKEEREEWKKQN